MARVVYVPGNHDPASLLSLTSSLPRLTSHSCNVHGQVIRIADELVVVGLGGSTDAHCDGEVHWRGYPYTEDEVACALRFVLAGGIDRGELEPNDSIILMTHTGPREIATTEVLPTSPSGAGAGRGVIQAGSSAIRSVLEEAVNQSRIILNVHGHVHDAPGIARLGNVPVVNPGSLAEGGFAVIELGRRQQTTSNCLPISLDTNNYKWELVSVDMGELPSLFDDALP